MDCACCRPLTCPFRGIQVGSAWQPTLLLHSLLMHTISAMCMMPTGAPPGAGPTGEACGQVLPRGTAE